MLYFNEIFTNHGHVRAHYADIYNHWRSVSPKQRRLLHDQSKRLFSGDYAQDPLPRILTAEEFVTLRRGVDQRARAILAFLRDYCNRGSRWRRIMPAATLNAMILRHHSSNALRKIGADRIAFPYGPDIIRDRAGYWRVIEDSAGIIGGWGDLLDSRKILYRTVPAFQKLFSRAEPGINEPLDFFRELSRHFVAKATG